MNCAKFIHQDLDEETGICLRLNLFSVSSMAQIKRRSQALPFLAGTELVRSRVPILGPTSVHLALLISIPSQAALETKSWWLRERLSPVTEILLIESKGRGCILSALKGVPDYLGGTPVASLPSKVRSEPELQNCTERHKAHCLKDL